MTLTMPVWGLVLTVLSVILLTRLWGKYPRREITDAQANKFVRKAYNDLTGAFHHSQWLSVGVVCDMLHSLSQGNGIDTDHMRDYNAVQYLQLNGFSQSQIEEILNELDEEGERIGFTNVGNVTGIGDDLLPNLYQEAARLLRAQFAEIEVRKTTEQALQADLTTLRDELQAQHLRDSMKEE